MNAAPSMTLARLQTAEASLFLRLETWLESERDQIGLWLPVALGAGIAAWFVAPLRELWVATILIGIATGCVGLAIGLRHRLGLVLLTGGLCFALGCVLIWWRAEAAKAPRLSRPVVASFTALVDRIEPQPARLQTRLWLRPAVGAGLPPLIRISVKDEHMLPGLAAREEIRARARLVPPPESLVPGSYDFSRTAWFLGLGATGRAMAPLTRVSAPNEQGANVRTRLANHVRSRIEGSAGGIAAAFATGDRGGISPEDEDAMRDSGLTHLLSISGLHITAVVAATMILTLRLLALSPALALRWPLPLIAAGAGALAGIGYTALTGAEVPTIRSCIAALLILIGVAIGREAMTLRLVAAGALVILLVWPEALVGASFQLSFAAITAIVALHETSFMRQFTLPQEESWWRRLPRTLVTLLITGIAVELALAPIALFHFHKSGIYGALANIIAIPLTTFVTMPLEAMALLLDPIGISAPFWWLTAVSLELLLWLARTTAAAPGAVAVVPQIPSFAFGMMVGGGLWLLLWKHRLRLAGLIALAAGVAFASQASRPDLLVTGDGRHLVFADRSGNSFILRPRTGDYVRNVMSERMGIRDELDDIDSSTSAHCSPDLCLFTLARGGRSWRIAATRSDYPLPWRHLIDACTRADIIISSRSLPPACRARWLTVDSKILRKTGGLAIVLNRQVVVTAKLVRDDHPWRRPPIHPISIAP